MSNQITRFIHGNSDFSYQEATKAVSIPIYQTATFGHIGLGRSTGFDYKSGGPWLEQCRNYLRDNLDYLRGFLAEHIPQIRLVEPEGTYFAWLDCSGLGLSCRELNDLIVQQAKLWLDAGHIFGGHAGQFQRVVLACSRATLQQVLEQLEQAVFQRNPS